jgi:pimeloyl-ACP methyl ester carboxylesterase
MAVLRREPSQFWRRAQRETRELERAVRHPVAPLLPLGTLVRVPDRGEMFVRYLPGPPGAPTVLLLHGWMASADINWLGAFPALNGRYHVLAMDLRGHGRGIRSTEPFTLEDCADDAAALLHTLGIRDAIVAGYSMGGPVALLMARRHRRRVRGLVLAATAADLGRTGGERGMSLFVRLLGPLLRSGVQDLALRHLARRDPDKLGELGEIAPWLAGEMKRLHPIDVVDAGKAIAAFDAREWLDEIRVPVCSVVTTRDWAVRPAKQYATAVALDAAVIELDAGHVVCATDPAAFGSAVREALDVVVAAVRRDRWLDRISDWWQRLEGVGPTEELSTGEPATVPFEIPNATRQLPTRHLPTGQQPTRELATQPVTTRELATLEQR